MLEGTCADCFGIVEEVDDVSAARLGSGEVDMDEFAGIKELVESVEVWVTEADVVSREESTSFRVVVIVVVVDASAPPAPPACSSFACFARRSSTDFCIAFYQKQYRIQSKNCKRKM